MLAEPSQRSLVDVDANHFTTWQHPGGRSPPTILQEYVGYFIGRGIWQRRASPGASSTLDPHWVPVLGWNWKKTWMLAAALTGPCP